MIKKESVWNILSFIQSGQISFQKKSKQIQINKVGGRQNANTHENCRKSITCRRSEQDEMMEGWPSGFK